MSYHRSRTLGSTAILLFQDLVRCECNESFEFFTRILKHLFENASWIPLTPLYTRTGRLLYAQISIRTTRRPRHAATPYSFSSPDAKPSILRRQNPI